jgi:hypothetical protein
VKYYLMRWDMVQDGWIKVEVLSIVIEWSLVDNLVTSENKGKSAEISKKKSHNLRHTIQYLTLVKKCLRFHDTIIWGCYNIPTLNYDERSTIIKYKRFYTESHTNVDNNAEVLQQYFIYIYIYIYIG